MKKKLKIPLYFGNLVIHQVSKKRMNKLIKDEDLSKHGISAGTHDAFVFKKRHSYHMVFKKGYCNARVVAHEALHVVHFIFSDRGIDIDIKNDESECYLLGWIVGKCHKHLKLRKIRDV